MTTRVVAAAGLALAGLTACSNGSGDPSFEATVPYNERAGISGETTIDQTGRYSCAGTTVTANELENLAGLPAPDEATFALTAQFVPLSSRDAWAELPSGWLVDRRPLEAGGFTGLLVAEPTTGTPFPCVPVTTLEPVTAWRQASSLVPPGGPGPEALAAARCSAEATTDGISVYWWDVPAGASWEVVGDGGAPLIAGVAEATAPATSGVLDQAFAERMVGYGAPATDFALPTGEAAAQPPQGTFSDFGALGVPLGTVRAYALHLTVAGGEHTVDCGSAVIPAQLPVPTCTLSLFAGHPQIVLDDGHGTTFFPDMLTIRRDGEPLTLGNQWGPPIDVGAEPGSVHHYQVEVRDRMLGRAPVTADCGSITAAVPTDDSEAIRAGAELFRRVVLGSYLYATAEVDGRPVDLVMQSDVGGFVFAPGHPGDDALSPYTVHDRLLEAINAGRSVTFELDPATGLPRTWTIDGVTRGFRCVNTDTQPPDIRPTTACDQAYNLLSPDP